ncbi:MAG: VWA domain-containing protein [Proteobacteria bacterium]|jgi:hypothetical protein|nr:VWA domain-containing protein [Pseudomonadota bacterium]MDA0958161.1 VWA domain-containing protein [Pseudomonadota bacterium]MDA1206603.1 VWA domain-containing protein [Pseudomonadota bacterium]
MKRRSREVEGMSLSFLDVISCGFGALILLLVLTKVFDPVVFDRTIEDLDGYLQKLEQTLMTLKGETQSLNRELVRRKDLQSDNETQLTEIQKELAALEDALNDSTLDNASQAAIKRQLALAKQRLTEEMQALLKGYQKSLDETVIGGIPVDSEYVIFIIDTSGSMFSYAWPLVVQKLSETLEVYPNLKGIQVMNDMGQYMFAQYAGQWIPDTPARRRAILERLRDWNVFSNSSPVEGITKAISTFYRPGRKISLYVFGDEFTGRSIQQVIDSVDRINRRDENGKRLVRIHGVGFPVQFANPPEYQDTGIKFAILMRTLCAEHDGTFVALNRFR